MYGYYSRVVYNQSRAGYDGVHTVYYRPNLLKLTCILFFSELPTIWFFSGENSKTDIMLRSRLALAKITKSLAADFSFRKETRIA